MFSSCCSAKAILICSRSRMRRMLKGVQKLRKLIWCRAQRRADRESACDEGCSEQVSTSASKY